MQPDAADESSAEAGIRARRVPSGQPTFNFNDSRASSLNSVVHSASKASDVSTVRRDRYGRALCHAERIIDEVNVARGHLRQCWWIGDG